MNCFEQNIIMRDVLERIRFKVPNYSGKITQKILQIDSEIVEVMI
jgi:hypothetical protein